MINTPNELGGDLNQAKELGAELKRVRRLRKFSLPDFAHFCGISMSTIQYVECGKIRGSKELWRRFSYVLDWNFEIPEDLMESGKRKLKPLREIKNYMGAAMLPHKELKRWEFKEGRKYSINKVKYIFLRKEGIHHIFMRAGCNWLTTYTDSQLVDISIKD